MFDEERCSKNHTVKISRETIPITSCGFYVVRENNQQIFCRNGWIKNLPEDLFERVSYPCPICNKN